MANDVERIGFRVQPVDEDGHLQSLQVQKTMRVERRSSDGRVLDYGWAKDVGEPMEIPVHKLADLVREFVSWAVYFADGNEKT